MACGITHFDTAHVYNEGHAETLLGQFMATERDALVVATKVGYTGGAGRANMFTQFDACRTRLAMDHVDILYLHRFDADTPLEETMDAFATLKARGQITYIGLSNFAAWQVMKAQAVAARFDLAVSIFQPMYSLVKRQAEVEILPMCVDQGIEIASYSPLGGGVLTGKYLRGETGRLTSDKRYAQRYATHWIADTTQELVTLADELGYDPAVLAVAWCMAHPSRPRPIISARTAEQLGPSLAALDFKMSEDLYDRISALAPKPAPATDRLDEA
jgi:aryl-alcohol dehydrogenase-like predicted oxidoreductase